MKKSTFTHLFRLESLVKITLGIEDKIFTVDNYGTFIQED
jgi:hypothetical protein